MANPSKLVESFYTQRQLSVLLGKSNRTIVDRIRAGEFGDRVVLDGWDYLVPASAVNFWLEQRRLFPEVELPAPAAPVVARTEGELRRKRAQRSAPAAFSAAQ